jgi:hypothetical protein
MSNTGIRDASKLDVLLNSHWGRECSIHESVIRRPTLTRIGPSSRVSIHSNTPYI